ncbi:MAG: transporter substrate-binding domain-containing protein, partial [Comamonadaceae bacterium]
SRARRYDFGSEVVLSSWNEVYAQPRLGIRYMAQLGGRRVAVLRGSVQEEAFRSTALAWGVQPVVEHFDTFEAAFAAAEAGRVDAVVANPFFAKRRGGAMSQTAIVFGSYALHYAATRGRHPDVLTALDRELARAKADPMSAYAREFESLVRTQRAATVPRWVPAAIAAVAVLLAVLLAWAASSRRATRRLAAAEAAQRQLAEQRRQLLEEACAREQRLRQANDDLHIVSQTLSHDLRAPLAAVHGFLSAVQERSAAALDGRAQHLLRRSMAAAQRMDGMVRDLGAMLRVAGQPLHLQRCDLTAMAQGVVDGLRIHQPGHPEVVIAPGLQGRADAQMLRVALENL